MEDLRTNVLQMLDGLRTVVMDDERGIIFVWNGDHTALMYDQKTFEFLNDQITFDFEKQPTAGDFRQAVNKYLEGGE